MKNIIMIPARLNATRFPNKPLAKIHGKEMVIHCVERGLASDVGDVYVAAGDKEIYDCVHDYGYKAILTDPALPSGTDRIFAALEQLPNQQDLDIIVNLQGDLPSIEPNIIKDLVTAHQQNPHKEIDITTPVVAMRDKVSVQDHNIVKAITAFEGNNTLAPALYFTRAPAPWFDGLNADTDMYKADFYHHLGVYAYKRDSLQKFVKASPHPLEIQERLEQLRALVMGQKIWAVLAHTIPQSVDTPEDLLKAQKSMSC